MKISAALLASLLSLALVLPVVTASPAAAVSANNSTLTSDSGTIVDTTGVEWKLVKSADRGYQISRNGEVDLATRYVTLLVLYNGLIYQRNAGNAWYYWSESSPHGWVPVTAQDESPKTGR